MKNSKKRSLLRQGGWVVFADGTCWAPVGQWKETGPYMLRFAWAIYLRGVRIPTRLK
jgi:hypothetical protein